jgi:hypothetical protein
VTRKERRKAFIRDIVEGILDHQKFPKVLREVVLTVVVEQQTIHKIGIGKSFMACCHDHGVEPMLTDDGGLRFLNADSMTPELRVMAGLYRPEITEHLKTMVLMNVSRKTVPAAKK